MLLDIYLLVPHHAHGHTICSLTRYIGPLLVQCRTSVADCVQGFRRECLKNGVQKGWRVWGPPPGENKL